MKINFYPKSLGQFNPKSAVDEIKDFIHYRIKEDRKFLEVVMLIMPNQMKNLYKRLKKLCFF